MPFDSLPQTETQDEVFSLRGLIKWLEKQDPATEYDFFSYNDCLLCRYGKAMGLGSPDAAGSAWDPKPHTARMLYRKLARLEMGNVRGPAFYGVGHDIAAGSERPSEWTYGKALSRARALAGKE